MITKHFYFQPFFKTIYFKGECLVLTVAQVSRNLSMRRETPNYSRVFKHIFSSGFLTPLSLIIKRQSVHITYLKYFISVYIFSHKAGCKLSVQNVFTKVGLQNSFLNIYRFSFLQAYTYVIINFSDTLLGKQLCKVHMVYRLLNLNKIGQPTKWNVHSLE